MRAIYGFCTHRDITIETFDSYANSCAHEIVQKNQRIKELENILISHNIPIPSQADTLEMVMTLDAEALIARSRMLLMTRFLEMDRHIVGDVLLFVDNDIVFTRSCAERIVEDCLRTRAIVGGMYTTRRGLPFVVTKFFDINSDINIGSDELIEVERVSGGFMAIHRSVVEAIAADARLFNREGMKFYDFCGDAWSVDEYGDFYDSEDWQICNEARKRGFKIYLDPQICLGHVGKKIFTVFDTPTGAMIDPTVLGLKK